MQYWNAERTLSALNGILKWHYIIQRRCRYTVSAMRRSERRFLTINIEQVEDVIGLSQIWKNISEKLY